MVKVEYCARLPMKVVCDKGYLLVERVEGVAYNPPAPFNSTANS